MSPKSFPAVGMVDARFQSYNVEMVEVIGGRFWKPYASRSAQTAPEAAAGTPGGLDPSLFEQRKPIDLADPRLRHLAQALGPAYLRVSGTWANTVYFQDTDGPAMAAPSGYGGVLTRAQWRGVVEFAHATGAKIVTSFSVGMGTRDAAGRWTPVEAKPFLAYNRSIGGPIAAAEFINEPTFPSAAGVPPGYDAAAFARDFAVFKPFFRAELPDALLLGPGSVGEGSGWAPPNLLGSAELLKAVGPKAFDVFSYHFYGAVSQRCAAGMGGKAGTSEEAALSPEWLNRTGAVEAFYAGLRDRYEPGLPMWVTETGQAACGGDRWASTFVDSFRYLDQLGQLARRGVRVVMHNTLAASDYGLIDERTLQPRPDYWAALLWSRTMGTTVLDPGAAPEGTRVYAQCMKGHPGGVTVLALNLNPAAEQTLTLGARSVRYTLTAESLTSGTALLNGRPLAAGKDGELPQWSGEAMAAGAAKLPPASISFFTMGDAGNAACR